MSAFKPSRRLPPSPSSGSQSRRDPIPFIARLPLCAVCGVLAAMVGTGAHRMGASVNIPYGLALGLALMACSSVMARALAGSVGLGVHLIVASITVWQMTGYGPGGDIMMPTGGSALTTFFSLRAAMIWFYGMLLVQVVVLVLPSTVFDRFRPGSAVSRQADRSDASRREA